MYVKLIRFMAWPGVSERLSKQYDNWLAFHEWGEL